MKNICLTLISFFIFLSSQGQDQIIKIDKKIINCKVMEIGVDEVKYKKSGTDEVVYSIENSRIDRIVFENGEVHKFLNSFKDLESYDGDLMKAVKFNFLSPLLGFTQIGFEKAISPLQSYEIGFGIIGAGKNTQPNGFYIGNDYQSYRRDAFGFFGTFGYKFNKLPDYLSRGTRISHVMQGTYVEPMIMLGYYKDHALNYKNNQPELVKRNNVFGGLLINLGRQWVFGDKLLLDLYGGVGYGIDNRKNEDYYNWEGNHFAMIKGGDGTNLALTGGLRIGLLIK